LLCGLVIGPLSSIGAKGFTARGWPGSERIEKVIALGWGDTIHMASIQLAHPEATWVFDADPVMAVESRQRLLDRVSADRTRIAGMHLDFPGYGFVKARDGRYFIEPE
jgi:hypothetical protein